MPTDVILEPLPVAAARRGEAEAWDVLFQRYQLPLYTYVYELLRDEQASLDVVQESFINATRYLGSLREDQRFGSWPFGIAHQKCLQHWRRLRRHDVWAGEPEEHHADDLPDPGVWLVRQEDERQILSLVDRLPPPQRAVFLLHVLEDLSLEEIGQIVDAPIGTVKSRLFHARQQLRRQLPASL